MSDAINHPQHYADGRKFEPIDVIEDWKLNFHLGNALKYISRAGRKQDVVEDLKKAAWYIQREISRCEEGIPMTQWPLNYDQVLEDAAFYSSQTGQEYLREYGNGYDDPLM
jgi:hypothetical protein